MNLSDITNQVRISIGSPTTVDVPDSTLYAMINFAYKEIADKFRFHKTRKICQFTTEAGVDKYTIPAGANLIFRTKNITSDWDVKKLTDVEFEATFTPDYPQGAPTHFARYRDYLKLRPIPDGEYIIELFYQFEVVTLVNIGDEPVLPETWHVGIIKLARHYYYDFVKGDAPKSINALNSYKMWLADKPVEVHEESAFAGDFGVSVPSLARARRGSGDDE